MESKRQNPIWPYLAILAFLFVLSLTAPRAWERKSRPEARSIAAVTLLDKPAVAPETRPRVLGQKA